MEDEINCSECSALPAINDDTGVEDLDGWEMEGEFGARCPECRMANLPVSPPEGLETIAEIVDKAPKKQRTRRKAKNVDI